MATDKRLVHLDLKGAPPKISYYAQLFPLLHRWGATGLLVEYEDMFPFSGDLALIQAPHAYSEDDIKSLLELAKASQLEVIPLVQTFGHFEYVLKHTRFHELREIADYPMTLCPLHQGSLEVVQTMIEQVIRLHPDISYFHIGADEVFHIGICNKCTLFVAEHEKRPSALFFHHISRLLDYLHTTYPQLSFIMWDDMYRQLDVNALKGSGISQRVEPMIWYYMHNFDALPTDLFERYSAVFPNVWCATAFKGATGPCMNATDIGYHVCNHQGWLQLAQTHKEKFQAWRGTAITGWQRYDHFSVLCELLPVGLPSLTLCLFILRHGAFTLEVHEAASKELGFTEVMPLNPYKAPGILSECSFPGAKVFVMVQCYLKLCADFKFIRNDRMKGWMSRYHVKHMYANPAHLHHFLPQAKQLLGSFIQLKKDAEDALLEIFYPDAVEEWITNCFELKIAKLEDIVNTTETLALHGARPRQEDSMEVIQDS